jgi:ribosomal protein L30
MSYYRIQLKRSTIALPKAIKETVAKLGLGKTGSVAYQRVNPMSAGMILKVKDLVDVKLVDQALSKAQERDLRKTDPGFTVEKAQT